MTSQKTAEGQTEQKPHPDTAYLDAGVWHLFSEGREPMPWPDDWPERMTAGELRAKGFEVVS